MTDPQSVQETGTVAFLTEGGEAIYVAVRRNL
jgi:hypothetical protein